MRTHPVPHTRSTAALCAAALVMLLAACGERTAPAVDDDVVTAPATTTEPPEADVPPATAPQPAPAAAAPPADTTGLPTPAAGAIGYAGFGPARFGGSAESVRMAWGREMDGRESEPDGCHYLFPLPRPAAGYRLGFMIEGGKFARIDVDAADILAPGGGRVGMSATQIEQRYAGRVERHPHKYVDGGQYLRVRNADGGAGVLVFEAGADGIVDEWRVGVPPQVDYVEGCG